MQSQSCFVVTARYAPGAAGKRAPFREAHLERMAKLMDEGAVVFAGAFEDLSASLLVFAVDAKESVEAVIRSDIYWKKGIWTGYTIQPFNQISI